MTPSLIAALIAAAGMAAAALAAKNGPKAIKVRIKDRARR